jgi:uncharacterized membrane protein
LAWLGFINSSTAKNITIIAGVIAALLYLNSTVFRPVYESGPPPFPSRAEVDKLRTESQQSLVEVNKGLLETVEIAKTARIEAQQAVRNSDDNRLTRLLQQKLQLEATIKAMPNDPVFNDLLARTLQEIARLTAATAVTPPPSTKE